MKTGTEIKKRFKLYKSGKLWLIAGLSSIMFFGGSYLMGDQQVQADVMATTAVTATSDSQSSEQLSSTVSSQSDSNVVSATSTSAARVTEQAQTVTSSGEQAAAVASSTSTVATPASTTVSQATSAATAQPAAKTVVTTPVPAARAVESIDSWMPDKNFQLAVLKELTSTGSGYNPPQILPVGSTVKDITKDAVNKLKSISVDSYNVTSLEGIQFATNLIRIYAVPNLSLGHNQGLITDISPLANLNNLQEVTMFTNRISDISPLANKPKLTSVSLSYNQITDLRPLMSDPLASGHSAITFQAVSLPTIRLNSHSSFTMSSAVWNLLGQNLGVELYYADRPGYPYMYAQNYKNTATGTNTNGQTIGWTDLSTNAYTNANGVKYGYLTYYWTDPFQGDVGYPYFGWVIQPYIIDDTVGNMQVNYVLDGSKETIHTPTLVTGKLGDKYQITQNSDVQKVYNELISQGYYLYGTSGAATGTFTEQSQSATMTFSKTPPTYGFNVHYQTETGRTISPDTAYSGELNTDWTVATSAVDGYKYLYAKNAAGAIITNLSGQYSPSVGDITLVYGLVEGETPSYEPAKLHVKYVDQNGNELKAEQVKNGYAGNRYDVTAPEIDGYKLVSDSNYKGTLVAGDHTVTFKYELIEGETPNYDSATLHVKYVDQNGNSIKTEQVKNGYAGNGYDVTAPAIDGYKVVSDSNYKGTLVAGDQTVTFTYRLIEGEVPETKPGKIHIEFVDQNGKTIQTAIDKDGFAGNGYLITPATIAGYHYIGLGSGSAAL